MMIQGLPKELTLKIMENFEIETLVKLSRLNKQFYKMINDLATVSATNSALFWDRHRMHPSKWLIEQVKSGKLSPIGLLKTLKIFQKLENQKNKLYKPFLEKFQKCPVESFGMKIGRHPVLMHFPPEILSITNSLLPIPTLNQYINKFAKALSPEDAKKILNHPEHYKLKKSNYLIIPAMKNCRLDTLKVILNLQRAELRYNQENIFFHLRYYRYKTDRKIAIFNLIMNTLRDNRIPISNFFFFQILTGGEDEYLINGIKECNRRGCLNGLIDFLLEQRDDADRVWEIILTYGKQCNHPLFQFGQKINLGEYVDKDDLPKNSIIPTNFFRMAIEHNLSFEIRKKMLENNIGRCISIEEFDHFEYQIKSNSRCRSFLSERFFFMKQFPNNIRKILDISLDDIQKKKIEDALGNCSEESEESQYCFLQRIDSETTTSIRGEKVPREDDEFDDFRKVKRRRYE